jgi:hypothetical protein
MIPDLQQNPHKHTSKDAIHYGQEVWDQDSFKDNSAPAWVGSD